MGRVVLGVVGGVVGYFAGGPSGAYYGFALGYGVGALTEEGPKGPRLSDLRFTSSQYGQPIPWIRGAPRISGSIVWASEKREVSSGGKGGSEGEQYSYEIDVLVLLCDHPAYAVSRIWSNGKLIWTRRATADDTSLAASDFSDLWRRMQFYDGNDAQLPDPTYEAAVGMGNAPAYRGRSTLMLEGLQLGSSGQLPNLTFEVLQEGTESLGAPRDGAVLSTPSYINIGTAAASGSTTFMVAIGAWDTSYLTTQVNVYDIDTLSAEVSEVGSFNTSAQANTCVTGTTDVPLFAVLHLGNSTTIFVYSVPGGAQTAFNLPATLGGAQVRFAKAGSVFVFGSSLFGGMVLHKFTSAGGSPTLTSAPLPDYVNSLLIVGGELFAAAKTAKVVYRLDLATLTLQETIQRPSFGSGNADNWPVLFVLRGELGLIAGPATGTGYRIFIRRAGAWVTLASISSSYVASSDVGPSVGSVGSMLIGGLGKQTSPHNYRTWSAPLTLTPDDISLQSVVEGLCERAGMPAGTYDATALAAITKPVRSLAVSGGATRATLEQLGTAFFFQASLRDKLYFRPRGGSVAATIPWSDLAASANGDGADDQALPLNVGNELELPPQVAVSYINVNDDAQAGTEHSDRMTVGQAAVRTISLGIGMTPAEAKGVADAVVADTAAALLTGAIALPISYARLDPADVVEVVDTDGRTYRLRLDRKRDERGVLAFEVAADDPSAIVSQQITDTTQTPAANVSKPGDTLLQALDVPLLRDADDAPGFYVAAKGSTTIWPGGQALISSNNVDYTLAAEVNESAVFGVCTTTLGAYTGIGFDERNTLTVNVGNGELASSTRDAMLADDTVNALLVGSEVIRFRAASLSSPGVYVLSGLLRGQRGTEWAVAGHVASERCVLLRTRGLRRVAQDASENGQLRYLRGATLGATPTSGTTQFANTNVGLRPLAPVDIRAQEQANQDLLLTWRRRSRLSARFLATGGVPLGEAAESYIVRVYAPPSSLKRTLVATGAAAVTYTRAQQIADGFSSGADVRVDVVQVSAVVGDGYAGTATVRAAATPLAQVVQITLGGTFASGAQLYAQLGATRVEYTTVGGDTDLAGAATSFAAAIDATPAYAASAAGAVITVTGPMSTSYAVEAGTATGGNTITFSVVQTASDTVVGVPNELIFSWRALASPGFVPAMIGTLLVQRISPPLSLFFRGDTFSAGRTDSQALAFIGDGVYSQWVASGAAATYGLTLVRESSLANFRLFTPASQPNNWTCDVFSTEPSHVGASLGNTARGVDPATARPQIITATLAGTPTAGWVYRITLAGIDFDYTATGGDTMSDVAAGLAALIDAHADYTANDAGPAVEIAHVTNNVPYTYSGRILSSTIVVDAVITQQAA